MVDTGNKIGESKDMDTGNKTVRMGKLIWGTQPRDGEYITLERWGSLNIKWGKW
jgi:hypothetical protein